MTTCISLSHKGINLNWNIDDETEAERVATGIIAIVNGQRTPKPRRRFTPEQLQEIADAHHAAPEGGTNRAIRELLGVSRQDATNYINRCRALGLIAPPRKARPVEPTPAPVHVDSFVAEVDQVLASHPVW